MKEKNAIEQQLTMKVDELKISLDLKNNDFVKQKSDYENMVNLLNNDIGFKDKKIIDGEKKLFDNEKNFINIKNMFEKDLLNAKSELSLEAKLKSDLDQHVQILTVQNSDINNRMNLVKQDADANNMQKINTIRSLEEKTNALSHERFAVEVELKSKVDELQRNLEMKVNECRAIKNESDNMSN